LLTPVSINRIGLQLATGRIDHQAEHLKGYGAQERSVARSTQHDR
jgi:hypothetical protein